MRKKAQLEELTSSSLARPAQRRWRQISPYLFASLSCDPYRIARFDQGYWWL
jgi:hypothetical protein